MRIIVYVILFQILHASKFSVKMPRASKEKESIDDSQKRQQSKNFLGKENILFRNQDFWLCYCCCSKKELLVTMVFLRSIGETKNFLLEISEKNLLYDQSYSKETELLNSLKNQTFSTSLWCCTKKAQNTLTRICFYIFMINEQLIRQA